VSKVIRLGNKVLAVLVVFALVIFPLVSGAVASQSLQEISKVSKITLTSEESSTLSAKALKVSRYNNLKNEYNFNDANAVTQGFSIDEQDYTSVSIPIRDNTGDSYSKYIVIFDSTGKYLDSLLLYFHKTDNTYNCIAQNDYTKIVANIAQDGSLQNGTFTDEKGKQHDLASLLRDSSLQGNETSNPLVSALSPKAAYASTWTDCFEECLSDSGVPAYVITLIGSICGVGCAVTAGAACIWCAIGVLAGYGSIGLTCAEHCWGWF